jgi:mannan endo-1,4-beta-mannosidase
MTRQTRAAVTLAATIVLIIAAGTIAALSLKHHHKQVAAAAAASSPAAGATTPAASPSPSEPAIVQASLPSTGFSYLGVYEGSTLTTGQYAQVNDFAQAVGRQPNIVLYYSGWNEGFSIPFAQTALQHGATLAVDIDPTSTSCAAIAAGQQDAFLESYAQSVKDFGHPVIISFGHEMNGNWYSWGWTHTSPATYVAAWRHIVDVFRQVGADNVTWLWTINAVDSVEGPIADYWPGNNYVTWVAFDAYYYNTTDDFSAVFGPSISAIRQVTNKPILIGETAIGQVAGQAAKLPGLFSGVAASGLLGFVWYDVAQDDGVYHQDWQLEGHPIAISAFRSGLATYFK